MTCFEKYFALVIFLFFAFGCGAQASTPKGPTPNPATIDAQGTQQLAQYANVDHAPPIDPKETGWSTRNPNVFAVKSTAS